MPVLLRLMLILHYDLVGYQTPAGVLGRFVLFIRASYK